MKKKCIICNKEFECFDNGHRSRNHRSSKRRKNAMTCSKKCAFVYNVKSNSPRLAATSVYKQNFDRLYANVSNAPCSSIVADNIKAVKENKPLTAPLAYLKTSCEFMKVYNFVNKYRQFYRREYYLKNKERLRRYQREWYQRKKVTNIKNTKN